MGFSVAGKYNKGTRLFDFDLPAGIGFKSLGTLMEDDGEGVVYTLRGLYINHKSKYGDAPVAVTEDCLVNLPKHLLDTAKAMLQDDDFIAAVNGEKVGFTIYTYTNKNSNSLLYSVRWVDINGEATE